MFEKKDHILFLINKYFRNDLTPEQSIELDEWLSESEEHRKLLAQFSDDKIMEEKINLFLDSTIPDTWAKVQQRMNAPEPVVKKNKTFQLKIYWWWAAAAVALLFAVTYFGVINKTRTTPQVGIITIEPNRILPEIIYKAELTLNNGRKVILQNEKVSIENQGIYQVLTHENYIYYKENAVHVSFEKDLYNTITTPKGGQFKIKFTDGKSSNTISMNVASSVMFKVSSPVRKVDLKGEAEFDIAHNANNPFRVILPSAPNHGIEGEVEVRGTRFNIDAYEENIDKKITLLDGVINVFNRTLQTSELTPATYYENAKKLLKPGDQAQLQKNGHINIIHQVDTSAVVSWKNRIVNFNEASTRKVLNTLELWYDVKVIYNTTKVPEYFFTGKITPETEIETVLEIMQFQCDALHLKFDPAKKEIVILP